MNGFRWNHVRTLHLRPPARRTGGRRRPWGRKHCSTLTIVTSRLARAIRHGSGERSGGCGLAEATFKAGRCRSCRHLEQLLRGRSDQVLGMALERLGGRRSTGAIRKVDADPHLRLRFRPRPNLVWGEPAPPCHTQTTTTTRGADASYPKRGSP